MSEYDDYPDEEWVEDEGSDDEDDTLMCPLCREEVHEDTQQCPHCGDWITPVYPGREWRKAVWTIAVVMIIISFLAFAIF